MGKGNKENENEMLEAQFSVADTSIPDISHQWALPQGFKSQTGMCPNRNLSGLQIRKLFRQKEIEEGRPAHTFGILRRDGKRDRLEPFFYTAAFESDNARTAKRRRGRTPRA